MRFPFRSAVGSFLSAVGKRFHIDAHYFAKSSFWILLSQAVGFAKGLVTGYIVARFFDQGVYGEYQFILSVMGVLGVFGLAGLATPVARAWSRKESFSLNTITRHQALCASVGSLILLGYIPFLGRFGKEELWPLFVAAALLFPLPPVAGTRFGAYTIGAARFDIALKANVIWSAITIVLTLLIVAYWQAALPMLVVSVAIPPIVYLCMARSFPRSGGDEENTATIIRYGWGLTFASLPADLAWYLDKLLISHFFGLNQLALFSVALIIPELAKNFTKQFFPVAFSKQASAVDAPPTRRKLTRAILAGTAVMAVGIACYVAVAPFAMPLLFPQYDPVQLTALTSVAALMIITNPATLFAQYLEAQGMIRETRISQWSAAVAFALSLFALIPTMGLMGAVIARGVFRAVYVGCSWWFVRTMPVRASAIPGLQG